MENNNDKLFGFMEKMYGEMQEGFKRLDSKVDKNTLILENIQSKLETVAEVQTAHKEQSEREHEKGRKSEKESLDIIELATTNISKDVVFLKGDVVIIKKKLNQVELVTANNWIDIIELKSAK